MIHVDRKQDESISSVQTIASAYNTAGTTQIHLKIFEQNFTGGYSFENISKHCEKEIKICPK